MSNKNKKIIVASAFSTIILALSATLYIGMSSNKKEATKNDHSHDENHDHSHHIDETMSDKNSGTKTMIKLDYKNPQVVAQGKKIYITNCASCHGNKLEGQPNWEKRDDQGYLPAPPQNEKGHTWHHNTLDLFKMTKHGMAANSASGYKTRMPAFENILTDDEIIAVLSFIKSQWPTEIQDKHNEIEATHR